MQKIVGVCCLKIIYSTSSFIIFSDVSLDVEFLIEFTRYQIE